MIGIDTNILVRYLAQDDPVQSPRARQIIERLLSEQDPGFISLVTITETVWVLRSSYAMTDQAIAAALELILRVQTLFVQNEREVATAMIALRTGVEPPAPHFHTCGSAPAG